MLTRYLDDAQELVQSRIHSVPAFDGRLRFYRLASPVEVDHKPKSIKTPTSFRIFYHCQKYSSKEKSRLMTIMMT